MKPGRPPKPVSGMGARLRMVRERMGLSQAAMAEDLRITRPAISAWEGGLRTLEGPALVAMESLYGVNLEWLLSGNGNLLSNKPARTLSSGLACPVLVSMSSWDTEGKLLVPAGALRRPISESEAMALLQRSGGGELNDLVFLTVPSGFPPSIPPDAQVLLNASVVARMNPMPGSSYLVRKTTDAVHGRLGRVQLGADWLDVGPPAGASWPDVRIDLQGQKALAFVLGQVLGCWWEF